VSRSTAQIAEALRAAAQDRDRSSELLASLCADEVVLSHDPRGESEGAIPGRMLGGAVRSEAAAVARALPDAKHVAPEITVTGDRIRMRGTVSGSLADGTDVAIRTDTVFRISNGRIVALTANMDAASAASWARLLAAGSEKDAGREP
jgi:hypothetical protein